jgi:hypothetical protein
MAPEAGSIKLVSGPTLLNTNVPQGFIDGNVGHQRLTDDLSCRKERMRLRAGSAKDFGLDISKLARCAQSLADIDNDCGDARLSFVRQWKERQVVSLPSVLTEGYQVNAGHQRHELQVVRKSPGQCT